MQDTDGNIYGTTGIGGASDSCGTTGCGTVFNLSVGLDPFVETLPISGKVDRPVVVLGNNLAGSTSVSFNGATAVFTVVSGTEIAATVPVGATTGFVTVTTPSGVLTSNKQFRVIP